MARTVNVDDGLEDIMCIRSLGGYRLPAAWREVALRTSDIPGFEGRTRCAEHTVFSYRGLTMLRAMIGTKK